MGDMGEIFSDLRRRRRAVRQYWPECPTCAERFGTGTKVPPGRTCKNCGRTAPGEAGSDQEAAKVYLAAQDAAEADELRLKAEKRAARTCPYCKWLFTSRAGMTQHMAMKHRKRMLEERFDDAQ
jgi:hypothetical protein